MSQPSPQLRGQTRDSFHEVRYNATVIASAGVKEVHTCCWVGGMLRLPGALFHAYAHAQMVVAWQ